jgi:hypothetical protein
VVGELCGDMKMTMTIRMIETSYRRYHSENMIADLVTVKQAQFH